MQDRHSAIIDTQYSIQESLIRKIFSYQGKIVVFDIGACEGTNAIRYAKMFPNSTIYAIEPLPNNVQHIKSNIARYNTSNVQCVEACFSEQAGISEFFVSSGTPLKDKTADWDFGNKASSLFPPDQSLSIFPWLRFNEKIEVRTTTLDVFCAANAINRIHFMHMDVQGAELLVLKGADFMLKNTYCIWLEVENIALYKGQPLKKDVEEFLNKHNFTKLLDKVGGGSGDQFWVNNAFPEGNKSKIVSLIKWINKLPPSISNRLRSKLLAAD